MSATFLAAACATVRTRAATRIEGPFDPSTSDPTALATVDAGRATLGAAGTWDAVEELRFEVHYRNDGKLEGWFQHRWDRWNGRHQFVMADLTTLAGGPAMVGWLEVRHDLFNSSKLPFATFRGEEIDDESTQRYLAYARHRFAEDTILFALIHRTRDPGVRLADGGVTQAVAGAGDLCKPECRIVRVTFDPAPGGGTWLVFYNGATRRPELVGKEVDGGRVVFRIDGWAKAGGLSWPVKLTNVGAPGEIYEFSGVAVGEPDDARYEPPRDRPDDAGMVKRKGTFMPTPTLGSDIHRKDNGVTAPLGPPPHGE